MLQPYRRGQKQKPMGIKPANLMLATGLAVIIEGLEAAPEWNGKRGLLHTNDPTNPLKVNVHDRYQAKIKGRDKPLGLKRERCRLEWVVDQERLVAERERVAQRRAEVEANVARALAAREND